MTEEIKILTVEVDYEIARIMRDHLVREVTLLTSITRS